MTIGTFITNRLRNQIGDEVSPFRWANDPELYEYATEALNWIWNTRPDAFYVSSIVTSAPSTITADADTIPLEPQYLSPLLEFMKFRCFGKDVEEAANLSISNDALLKFSAMTS